MKSNIIMIEQHSKYCPDSNDRLMTYFTLSYYSPNVSHACIHVAGHYEQDFQRVLDEAHTRASVYRDFGVNTKVVAGESLDMSLVKEFDLERLSEDSFKFYNKNEHYENQYDGLLFLKVL